MFARIRLQTLQLCGLAVDNLAKVGPQLFAHDFEVPTVQFWARLRSEAWRIAEELGWMKTYDAEYVALARLLRCRLFTVDARLRRGAGRVVEIIGPDDL